MKLQLTNRNPRRTHFVDENHYQVYSTHTPIVLGKQVTTIKRAEGGGRVTGTIQWVPFKDTILTANDRIVDLRRIKRFSLSRARIFTASNGLVCKWDLYKLRYAVLTLVDEPEKIIARYHLGSLGLLPNSQPQLAWLDISPEGEEIIDEILVTFVYFEHRRRSE